MPASSSIRARSSSARTTSPRTATNCALSSSDEGPWRFTAGLFYERQNHDIIQRYYIPGFADALSIPGWANTLWLTNQVRADTDYAAFSEVSYKITPDLTATAGGRVFESDNSIKGFFGYSDNWDALVGFSAGMPNCFAKSVVKDTPCTDLDAHTSQKGFTHKVNLTWQVDDDRMLYFTWSTGFRPGGVNRNAFASTGFYKPDYLTNYEVGWKTSWADDTLHWNGALYWEDWKNFQFSFLGPNSLTIIANAGQARIIGLESDIQWRATDHLTLTGGGSYDDAQLTQAYCQKCLKVPSADRAGRPAASDHAALQGQCHWALRVEPVGHGCAFPDRYRLQRRGMGRSAHCGSHNIGRDEGVRQCQFLGRRRQEQLVGPS